MSSKVKVSILSISLSVSVLLTTLCSCMADTRHLSFTSVSTDGWACTDTFTYCIAPLPGLKRGGVSLLLHTEGYQYENIAIDVTIRQDTSLIYHKHRNYLLSNSEAKKGIGHRSDYVFPIDNFTFCDTLPTTITIIQQLDQPVLMGIREVGIRIGGTVHQPGEPVWRVNWH